MNHFDYEVTDVKGLNWSARNLDHNLLNEMTRQDWLNVAEYIQEHLTDEAIEQAVGDMPDVIFEISGQEMIDKLKSRRDRIHLYAEKTYEDISEEVRIFISDKHERFEINRIDDDQTHVVIYKTKKEGDIDKKIYERTFYTSETKRLILMGLGGNDQFILKGHVNKGISVKIVGGEGRDTFINDSSIKGLSRGTFIEDYPEDFENFEGNSDTKVRAAYKYHINKFNLKDYHYDYIGPRVSFDVNPDDGLFLGAGLYVENNEFGEDPRSTHLFAANWSTKTSGFNARYEARFNSVFAHQWDFGLKVHGHNGRFAFNYFGQGIDTENTEPIEFYRVRLERFNIEPTIEKRFGRTFTFGFGPLYQHANVEERENTLITTDLLAGDLVETSSKDFIGAQIFSELILQDHPTNPSKGLQWSNRVEYWNEVNGSDVNFARLGTELSLYWTPNLPFRVTFAGRFGINHNAGDFLFYQSNFLGGQTNLRGFRRTRFAGKGSAYQNTEMRVNLFYLRNVVLNGQFGLIGFVDHGRVWTDQPNDSNKWVRTYGPGAFMTLYDFVVISAHYGITEDEGSFFMARVGFQF